MSKVFVGPKCSAIILCLGVWGVLMLALMGVFARTNSIAFFEDIPFNETKFEESKYSKEYIEQQYNTMSTNCFIAAGMYSLVAGFGGVMFFLNMRS